MKLPAAVLLLLLTGCASTPRCPEPDLGGWMVGEAGMYGVQHTCTAGAERFVLRSVASRRADGGVAGWTPVATLDVPLARGESTMFGFECGSSKGTRGDAIAVVRYRRDDSFEVKRAWIVDVVNRTFTSVPPGSVTCEPVE